MFNRKIGTISKKIHTPYEGMFGLGGGQEYVKEVTGTRYIDLTYAIANELLELKAYGGTEQRNIPSEYTQVEYIEGTGTQYINTGTVPYKNMKIRYTFSYSDASGGTTRIIWGSRTTGTYQTSTDQFYAGFTSNGVWYYTATNQRSSGTGTINTKLTYECTNSDVSTDATQPIYIFALNNVGTAYSNLGYKVYGFEVYNTADELVQNLVPVKNSNNEVGMYDTVSGTFLTNQGTGTFTAGSDVVPTPANPMDIVCNNGVIKVRRQNGLPLEYTHVEYLQSSGTQYIDTGIVPKTTLSAKIKYNAIQLTEQNNIAIFGSISSSFTGFFSGVAGNPPIYYINNGGSGASLPNIPFSLNSVFEEEYRNNSMIRSGTTYVTNPIIENDISMALFGRNTGEEIQRIGTLRIYSFTLYDNGVLIQNLIPAKRNSDNVLGMYDTVTNTFFTNAGTGTFTAGDTVSDPIEIYTDGTTETIEDSLGNTATAEMLLKVGDYKDVQSILDGSITRNIGIKVFDGTEDWTTTAQSTVYRLDPTVNFSLPNICICSHYAGAESGLAIASMPDMSIKTGSQTASYIYIKDSSYSNNLAGFKQYLTAQYSAGTPVIVIYPLGTSTTESVAGQTINIQKGNNTIEITQASIDNLQLYAKYKSTKQ